MDFMKLLLNQYEVNNACLFLHSKCFRSEIRTNYTLYK